jgi:hypothetical protein
LSLAAPLLAAQPVNGENKGAVIKADDSLIKVRFFMNVPGKVIQQ